MLRLHNIKLPLDHPEEALNAAIPLAASISPQAVDIEWKIPVYALHGSEDQLFDPQTVENEISKLQAAGADMQLKIVEGATHFDADKFIGLLAWCVQDQNAAGQIGQA